MQKRKSTRRAASRLKTKRCARIARRKPASGRKRIQRRPTRSRIARKGCKRK